MQASIVQWWMSVRLANDQKVLQSAWISLKAWRQRSGMRLSARFSIRNIVLDRNTYI